MRKKFYSWCIFIGFILFMWYVFASIFNNAFILPSPFIVINTMISFLCSSKFYFASLMTIFRVIISIVISFVFGFIASFICSRVEIINSFFSKLLLIIRTLPNVTIIILLLFWIPREMTVMVVTFFLLFPIIFEALFNNIVKIDYEYKDLFLIYSQSFINKFQYVYLPLLKTAITSSLISTGTLAFKVIVMAEILAQVPIGIGRQIQISKVNVELHEVMAWTIWIILFVFIFNYCYKKIIKFIFN